MKESKGERCWGAWGGGGDKRENMHSRIEILTEPDMEREGEASKVQGERRKASEGLADSERGQQNGHD